jgi:xanthine dehydrogenase YagR molybdenum-binding subunit
MSEPTTRLVSERPQPNPGPSRQQTLLYGIVGDGLLEVTRRVPADEPPPLPENAKLSSIGKPIPRLDAVQKVTGRARYTFDVHCPACCGVASSCHPGRTPA